MLVVSGIEQLPEILAEYQLYVRGELETESSSQLTLYSMVTLIFLSIKQHVQVLLDTLGGWGVKSCVTAVCTQENVKMEKSQNLSSPH